MIKCPRCIFEHESARMVEIHFEATHAQEMILWIVAAVRAREAAARSSAREK